MVQQSYIDVDRVDKAAVMMKAIAHPIRLAILRHLSEGDELTVSKIHELVKIEQSTASHHLGILKDKGILVSRRTGKNTLYALKNPNFKQLLECINNCACID
ncbi:MAG TPA: metalloregulator ArsR/SmtB family transcription factor [Bacteroidales bacterium]|nr:metalloregulator ArsR/SmtB family transcription factor [Bacteroidales bacterium]